KHVVGHAEQPDSVPASAFGFQCPKNIQACAGVALRLEWRVFCQLLQQRDCLTRLDLSCRRRERGKLAPEFLKGLQGLVGGAVQGAVSREAESAQDLWQEVRPLVQ